MSLLREIQASLMGPDQNIGPILLKLRFLASRLGSDPLAEWVRFESEGYPIEAVLPDYRILDVTYTVNTSGPFGSGIRNAPVPTALIEQVAGDRWINHECRQSITSIDNLVSGANDGGSICIDSTNLVYLLQDEIYPTHSIIAVNGSISVISMVEIQNAIRSRLLELTIGLENETPFVTDIALGPAKVPVGTEEQQKVSQIINQVIQENYTAISNFGVISGSMLSIAPKDADSVISALVKKGVTEEEAQKFAKILAEEKPESVDEPFGPNAKKWVADRAGKMASGAWKIGVSAGTKVLTEAALKFYGLK